MEHNSRLSAIKRVLEIDISSFQACFLWGPRKTGKTTFLKEHFPQAAYYDLLKSEIRTRFLFSPKAFREEILASSQKIVIVDEVQKVPELLDEIHWCLENTATRFILCGSSARKLKKGHANLLGGRAARYEMHPLVFSEIPKFDLHKALNAGLLPAHYLHAKPEKLLEGYVSDYLQEEIQSEALVRNIPSFMRFLQIAAISHGQLINFSNIAADCGVSPKTIRAYYQILEDTLLGYRLDPWVESPKRRMIETTKFYLFDAGVVRALRSMNPILPQTREFGEFFEHWVIHEIRSYIHYKNLYLKISFWRTSTGLEVDCIVGQMQWAIEIKTGSNVSLMNVSGLKALIQDEPKIQGLVVSMDERKRKIHDRITVYPWQQFMADLWNGKFF
jgi:predicted AAA+ superfamily ATPase